MASQVPVSVAAPFVVVIAENWPESHPLIQLPPSSGIHEIRLVLVQCGDILLSAPLLIAILVTVMSPEPPNILCTLTMTLVLASLDAAFESGSKQSNKSSSAVWGGVAWRGLT